MDTQPDGATVLHSDPATQAGFTIIPNVILRARRLSPGSRLLYGLLKMYAWQAGSAYPGQDRLAEEMGVSTRQIRNYQTELVSAGLIRIEQRGLKQTNRYWIEPIPSDFLSERKDPSAQDRNVVSDQDRKPVSDKEDTDQEDSVRREAPRAPERKSPALVAPGDISRQDDPSDMRPVHAVPKGTSVKARADAPPVLPQMPCPDVFPVTPAMHAWVEENAPELVGDIDSITKLFSSHYRGKDVRRANWEAVWQSFVLRKLEDAHKDRARAAPKAAPTVSGHPYHLVTSKGVAS